MVTSVTSWSQWWSLWSGYICDTEMGGEGAGDRQLVTSTVLWPLPMESWNLFPPPALSQDPGDCLDA